MRAVACLGLSLGLISGARVAGAEPEWNVAAEASLCGLGAAGRVWQTTGFCGAVRSDLLFGRERNADYAWGPYVKLGTATFSDARLGTGISLLAPTLGGDFPVLLSAGALTRNGSDARLSGQLFFGLRSHNFHGAYAMASGFILGGDASITEQHASTLYVGVQVDGLWLALPFILGYEWLRSASDPGD